MNVSVAGFSTGSNEPLDASIRKLTGETGLGERDFEGGRWMELAQDHVQWQALVTEPLGSNSRKRETDT
jgi:hypothetical protein